MAIVVEYRDSDGQWAYPGHPDDCECRDMTEAAHMIAELELRDAEWRGLEWRITDGSGAVVEPSHAETIGGRVAARRSLAGLTQEQTEPTTGRHEREKP